jgi:outer membrane protein assembly factor BamB
MAPIVSAGDELAIGSVEARKADSALVSVEAGLPADAAGTVPAPGEPEALITAGEVEGAVAPPPLPELEAAFPSASAAGAAARLVLKALADFASDVEERVSGQVEGQSPLSAAPVQAEPKKSPAILASLAVSQGKRLDSLVRSGSFLVASDVSGSIICLDAKGKVIWRVPVEKGSRPVLSKGYLYVSGTKDFAVINAATGSVERGSALPPGARLAAFPDGAAAASSAGLSLFRSGSANAWTTFPVNGGPLAVMSLNDKGNNLLVSLVPGGLAIVSTGDSRIAAVAPGPVAGCLRYYGSRAVAAGARADALAPGAAVPSGTVPEAPGAPAGGSASGAGKPAAASYEVALYALPELELLWSLPLALKPEADPELGPEGAFIYGEGRLEAYSLAGEAIGRLSGLSAPPLLSNGVLYYGLSDGSFIAAQASDLAVMASIRLPAALAARPIPFDGELRLPLSDGSIVALDPRSWGSDIMCPGDRP